MATSNKELMTSIKNAEPSVNKAPKTVAEQISHYLGRSDVKSQMAMALPKHIDTSRFTRLALTVIKGNPKLLACSMKSLVACIMESAQLGLEPGVLGQVYFVPFAGEVKLITGYKGLLKLARNSGEIQTIGAGEVYSNDVFEYEKGFEPKLRHIEAQGERGNLLGFYAYCLTKDGGKYGEFMTKGDVDKIRARSKSSGSGPWVTDYNMMGRKTVIIRLARYLPLSVELQSALAKEEETEFGNATKVELNLGEQESLDLPSFDWEDVKTDAIENKQEGAE